MNASRILNPTPASAGEVKSGIMPVPGWDRFSWLRAGFSTRLGGLSMAYGPGEQNLGWTAEDDRQTVAGNRTRFVECVAGLGIEALVTVRQVHGAAVRVLESEDPPFMSGDGKALLEGDGLISRTPGRVLAILTADCVPILVADTRTHAIGAFHAGWRGTLAHIAENGVAQMQAHYGSRPEDLVAAIGPCIQACCFEVGDEVRSVFVEQSSDALDLFSRPHDGARWRMDLVAANRRQLLRAGLRNEQITSLAECTACAREDSGRRRYFSYRAEGGITGRMLSAIAALN